MENSRIIEEYFNKLEIQDINNPEEFWSILEKKFGEDFCIKLSDAMNERNNGKITNRIYTVKNKALETSLEFTTYSKDLYRGYLNRIIDLNLDPKNILDIACDNGIVTCFYGILYPEAQVLGIDIGGNSIKCAKELAEKLALKNVKFEQVDIKKLSKVCKDTRFDIMSSVRSLMEIYNLHNDIRVWSLKEANEINVIKKQIFAINKLSEYLEDNGLLITFERLACSEEQVYFNNLFNKAGLVLNEEISSMIAFHELGDNQKMPLFIYTKGKAINSSYDIILNKFEENEEIIKYEKFINSADNKNIVLGVQVNFIDGSGKMRYELWQHNDKIVYLEYSNIGYRKFKVYENTELEKIKEKINDEKQMKILYGQNVYEYKTIEERDKIK